MHTKFINIKKRRLETPEWTSRNHHFYEKVGCIKAGIEGPIPEGFNIFKYEKEIKS